MKKRKTPPSILAARKERRKLDAQVCDACAAGMYRAAKWKHGADCSRRKVKP